MNLNKLTIKSQEALEAAQSIADENQNQSIEPEHLLLALLREDDGIPASVLKKAGANLDYIRSKVDESVKKFPKIYRWWHSKSVSFPTACENSRLG